ncbi:MAG: hypothetical protein N2508_05945 [Anaerolineae bacterium]|nr:hypothetical protein [Anaerolineae bacterium]
MLLVVGLPLVFFLVMYYTASSYPMPLDVIEVAGKRQVTVDHRDFVALLLAAMGMGWGVAATALSSVVGGKDGDRRLILCGYRAAELMVARLAVLMVIVIVLSFAFMVPVLVLLKPHYPLLVWLSVLLAGFVAVGAGMAIGAFIPRQLEATIGVIAVFGLEMAMAAGQATIERYLPLHFANELLKAGAFATEPRAIQPALFSLGYGMALFVVASLAWSVRMGLFERESALRLKDAKVIRKRVVLAAVLMLIGAVIALGSPEAYEGAPLVSISGKREVGLMDVVGAVVAIPACLYLNWLILQLLRRGSSFSLHKPRA